MVAISGIGGLKIQEYNDEIKILNKTISLNEKTIKELQEVVSEKEKVIKDTQREISEIQASVDSLTSSQAVYLGSFNISFYCSCEKCCGKTTGITASGAKVQDGVTVAADTSVLPFGSRIYIENLGWRTVQDRGGAIKGNRLDVYVASHEKAYQLGRMTKNVWVVM